jgi:hypothetical protein
VTGFDSKRQASKALLQQAFDALEMARDAHCLPGPVNTLVYQAINSISAEFAQENPWRDAIDAELICCHIGTADSFPDPKDALAALIDWHVAVALDPEVSSDAQALVDRGRAVAEPLTNEKISACSKGHMTRNGFARAIEAAHGIKWSAA